MYLLVTINKGGYIKADGDTIHKESYRLHEDYSCFWRLADAKAEREPGQAILALDDEGGGAAIWVPKEDREETLSRLQIWKGCYGTWPVYTLQKEGYAEQTVPTARQ